MKKNYISKFLILYMIILGIAAGFADSKFDIDIQSLKYNSGNLFLNSYNNSSLMIKYTPENQSDQATMCWSLNTSTAWMSNSTSKISDRIPIEVIFLTKGEQGNEWINIDIYIDGKVIHYSPTLSKDWKYNKIFTSSSGLIDKICLGFNPFKNPIGAIIYLQKIEIIYGKGIEPVPISGGYSFINPVEKSEFCCSCPDWSNLAEWLNKSELCCGRNASKQVKCPSGYQCLTLSEAKKKLELLGRQTYENYSKDVCGCNSNGEPQYCFNVPITLTLYVHIGSASGPILPGAQVSGQDGSGNSFQGTADGNGIVIITGNPGVWSFTTSAYGYSEINWNQAIESTCTKHGFLEKEGK